MKESMIAGIVESMNEQRMVRVQEKGQVTLPVEVRKRLGLKKGDLVAMVPTDDGVLITPLAAIPAPALARLSQLLSERGLSLDEVLTMTGSDPAELWAMVDHARERTAATDPELLEAVVTEEVEHVRRERYDKQQRRPRRR